MEKIETLAKLFREGSVSEYVMERELSAFLGDRVTVSITTKSRSNMATSYCIFPVPEKRVEGFHLTYFIDRDAILTHYNPFEFGLVIEKLRKIEQDILFSYNKFLSRTAGSDVTYGMIVGYLLDLYLTVKTALDIKDGISFLPSDGDVREKALKFQEGRYNANDIESVVIDNFAPKDALALAKNQIREASIGQPRIKFAKDVMELPAVNLGAQEIMAHCTSTFGVRDHKDIPWNYTPEHGQ